MGPRFYKGFCFFSLLFCFFPLPNYAGSPTVRNLTGEWGGDHIRLAVKETSTTVEFDCAFGMIDEALLPDGDGRFEAQGVYMFERGGPGRKGDPPPQRHPAQYRGWTDGREMRLTVILSDGREIGTFSLHKGRRPNLDKCL
jgi:hypothetical protein